MNQQAQPLRIAIFDDAESSLASYREAFGKGARNVNLHLVNDPMFPDHVARKLGDFEPDLIIVDLVMGRSRDDGYGLLRKLQAHSRFENIPKIIRSKLIGGSDAGQAEKARAERLPNVIAVMPKLEEKGKEVSLAEEILATYNEFRELSK